MQILGIAELIEIMQEIQGQTWNYTHPVILTRRQNSMSLHELSSCFGFWCSCTFTVPAEEVKMTRFIVPAFLQDSIMLNSPLMVGLITSF